MSFFEPPPPPPEEQDEPDEDFDVEWLGAPGNVLGAAVPIRLILARTDDVAIAITDASAYPNGFEFKLAVRSRRSAAAFSDPLDMDEFLMTRHRKWKGGGIPPEFLRFGIEFADGSKATNLTDDFPDPSETPKAPLLMEGSGGGGPGNWETEYWVWPLPPPGPFTFVCEWPATGIPLTRTEIDADQIREAAAKAETLWDEPRGRRSSSISVQMYGSSDPARSVDSRDDDPSP